jgi:hypothetical protein
METLRPSDPAGYAGGSVMHSAEMVGAGLLASGCASALIGEFVWRRSPFSPWLDRWLWVACGLFVSGGSLVAAY